MIVGITGNFGVGKTTVADMFRRLGAEIIDADRIAHRIIRPGNFIYKQIIAAFGKKVLSGTYISRKKLAGEVFSDKQKLKKLNKIMHPEILKIIKERIKKMPANKILLVDAALLIESGLSRDIDKLIVVKCNSNIQIQRLSKAGLSINQIKRRLRFQLPQKKKIGLADFIIDNSGRRVQTQKQAKETWDKINKHITQGGKGCKN